jgi:hypothetical protein
VAPLQRDGSCRRLLQEERETIFGAVVLCASGLHSGEHKAICAASTVFSNELVGRVLCL